MAAVEASVATRFLDAISRRDYDELAACFTPDATLRAIVPPGVREADGPEAIVERFRIWTEEIDDYAVLEPEAAPFADLLRLRWSVRGIDRSGDGDGDDPTIYEQTAYAEVSDGRIARMRLACSGSRPV